MSESDPDVWLSYEQEYYGSLNNPSDAPSSLLDQSNIFADAREEYFSDFAFFSKGQQIVLFLVGLTSCILSLLGSCLILYLVIRGKRTGELYHRLLMGLSISDLIVTLSLLFQPMLVPKITGYVFAIGNDTTCRLVGFGYLFFVASYAYNCMLGVYFLATVRSWKIRGNEKNRIGRRVEPICHFLAFVMPLMIGSVAVRFDLLNPNPFLGVCSLFPSDHECEWKEDIAVENGQCVNDQQYNTLNKVLDYYALSLVFIGLLCTTCVYVTVKKRYGKKSTNQRCCTPCFGRSQQQGNSKPVECQKTGNGEASSSNGPRRESDATNPGSMSMSSSRFTRTVSEHVESDDEAPTDTGRLSSDREMTSDGISNDEEVKSNDSLSLNPNPESVYSRGIEREEGNEMDVQEMRIRQIARQAVWYSAAYLVGVVCVVAANIMDVYLDDDSESLLVLGDKSLYYFVVFMIWLLFPLQGFFNAIIYIRPRLVRWKFHFEDCSWLFAFTMVLSMEDPPRWGEPTESRSSRTDKSSQRNKFSNDRKNQRRKGGSNPSKEPPQQVEQVEQIQPMQAPPEQTVADRYLQWKAQEQANRKGRPDRKKTQLREGNPDHQRAMKLQQIDMESSNL